MSRRVSSLNCQNVQGEPAAMPGPQLEAAHKCCTTAFSLQCHWTWWSLKAWRAVEFQLTSIERIIT
jgi:hypothetical protein